MGGLGPAPRIERGLWCGKGMVVCVLSDWIAGGSWGYAAGLADGRGVWPGAISGMCVRLIGQGCGGLLRRDKREEVV